MSDPIYIVTADASGKFSCAAEIRNVLTQAGILPLKLTLTYDANARTISGQITDTTGVALSNKATTAALPASVKATDIVSAVNVVDDNVVLLNSSGAVISQAPLVVPVCQGV